MGNKEEVWLRGILDGVGDLDPAWEALLAEAEMWDERYGHYQVENLMKLRLEIGVGHEFTRKELRRCGIEIFCCFWPRLEKNGVIRLVRKRILGDGGKGRIKNVYRRML